MQSSKLAKQFVHKVLVPRARQNDVLIVVTRKAREWDLPSDSGAIVYGKEEAQAAHLSESSRGGAAILKFLLKL
jgi:hypothetical protein